MQKPRYAALIEKIFLDRYDAEPEFVFERKDFEAAAAALGMEEPKNLGDVIYSFRYRSNLPESIRDTAPEGQEWVIEGRGKSKYRFRLVPINRITPNPNLVTVKIPDATPEIVSAHGLSDEQALLAKLRYNRLLDIFLGLTAFSLQNHLRTTVSGIGQIEIDELYVAVDKGGVQYVLPVQAKGGSDQLSVIQTSQDIACCAEKYPSLICRAISAQFLDDNRIAVFELTLEDGFVRVVDEKHYALVPAKHISPEDLKEYAARSGALSSPGKSPI